MPLVEGRLYPAASAAQHVLVTATRTRIWVLAVSVPAGPVIGIASFALVAFAAPSVAWPLGLLVLPAAPAFCPSRPQATNNATAAIAAVASERRGTMVMSASAGIGRY